MAFPLPFLSVDFIHDALTGDDASFSAAIAQLKAQTHIPVNANSGLLFGTESPITFALNSRFYMHKERAAVLIEALYTHCGIPTTPWVVEEGGLDIKMIKSPLWIAMGSLNVPASRVLLECKADFDANDTDVNSPQCTVLHCLASRGNEAVQFLTLLPNSNPQLNPNLNGGYYGNTALHRAVAHSNFSPGVVRLLIDKFGADPSIPNRLGALPLDTLNEMVRDEHQYHLRRKFKGTFPIFEERVLETERLLSMRSDRTLAVLMGVSLPTRNGGSELRHLDNELAAMLLALAALV